MCFSHNYYYYPPSPLKKHCLTYLFIFRFVTTVSLLIKFKVCRLLWATTLEDASGAINFSSSSSVLLRGTTESSSSSSSESSSPSSIESRIPSVDALLFFSENSSLSSRLNNSTDSRADILNRKKTYLNLVYNPKLWWM